MAELVLPQPVSTVDTPTAFRSWFNISWSNVTHTALLLPYRFLARLRQIDAMLDEQLLAAAHDLAGSPPFSSSAYRPPSKHTSNDQTGIPAPWRFLTSRYAFALLVTVFVLNRIHHIVVPPRSALLHRDPGNTGTPRSLLRSLCSALFPVNLTSPTTRFLLRAPTLYLLTRACILVSIATLQTAGLFPAWPAIQAIGFWVSQHTMDDICWFAFYSVCSALSVVALTRGLDGALTGSHAPFNFFGYAFLLHVYSSPITHSYEPSDLPSRPDKHVMITILMPLLQLTILHWLDVHKFLSGHRLLPTTICSLLTLAHFHYVLWYSSNPASYPLLNYLPCLIESLLITISLLVCALNALTQILLQGEITESLLGHKEALMPKWDEDFGVVVIRLGIASIEATAVAGLGNEVAAVSTPKLHSTVTNPIHMNVGEMDLGCAGITWFSPAEGQNHRRKRGFANEVQNVRPITSDARWQGTWYRDLWTFVLSFSTLLKGLWRLVVGDGRGIQTRSMHPEATPEVAPVLDASGITLGNIQDLDDDRLYERFLRDESISDDDDDEDQFDSSIEVKARAPSPSSSGSEEDIDGDEIAALEHELVHCHSDPETPPSAVLLAHMRSKSSLTRQRFATVAHGDTDASAEDEWPTFIAERRSAKQDKRNDTLEDESRRNCVVCTTEPREIICWPCRCLALCDDCRRNLASRLPPNRHSCPCCRRSVEGFSRIYIP